MANGFVITNISNMPSPPPTGYGFELMDMAETLSLDRLNMALLLPQFDVTAEIVEIPFAGDTWDVSSLRSNVGKLEGFALPGEGISIIAGHNTLGLQEIGPLGMIHAMECGDHLFVYNEKSMTLMNYEIYANRLFGSSDFFKILTLAKENPNSLVLITCENELSGGGYADRRSVFARPVSEN